MSIARALPIASRVTFTRAPRVGTRATASAFPGAARTRATPSVNGLPRGLIHRQPCGRKSNDTHRCDAFPPPGLEWIPTPEAVFNVENAAIFPFWLGMIAFPKSKVTETVMGSYAVPVLLGLVYIYLTYYSFSDPRIIEAFSTGKPDLAALSKGFSYEWCMAVGWAHFIAMDLFVGRWIYLDARKNDVFAAHSLTLCLFFGPTGVISHTITRAITSLARGEKLPDVMSGALAPKEAAGTD